MARQRRGDGERHDPEPDRKQRRDRAVLAPAAAQRQQGQGGDGDDRRDDRVALPRRLGDPGPVSPARKLPPACRTRAGRVVCSIQLMWWGLICTASNGSSEAPASPTAQTAGMTARHRSRSATSSQAASSATAKTAK